MRFRALRYFILIAVDVLLCVYLFFAMTSWNKAQHDFPICNDVVIDMKENSSNCFLSKEDVRAKLEQNHIYPLNMRIDDINTRKIERCLLKTPFVKNAQCYIARNGCVTITVEQKLPLVRVKNDRGEDYYLDKLGNIMSRSNYSSNLIIITGNVTRQFAQRYLASFVDIIMQDDFWANQIVQINVLKNQEIELIPRVGDHIINIGKIPMNKNKERREELISNFTHRQLHRIETFYKYGLSEAGWNKYGYLSFKYFNQVICRRHEELSKKPKQSFEQQIAEMQTENKIIATDDNNAATESSSDIKKEEKKAQ